MPDALHRSPRSSHRRRRQPAGTRGACHSDGRWRCRRRRSPCGWRAYFSGAMYKRSDDIFRRVSVLGFGRYRGCDKGGPRRRQGRGSRCKRAGSCPKRLGLRHACKDECRTRRRPLVALALAQGQSMDVLSRRASARCEPGVHAQRGASGSAIGSGGSSSPLRHRGPNIARGGSLARWGVCLPSERARKMPSAPPCSTISPAQACHARGRAVIAPGYIYHSRPSFPRPPPCCCTLPPPLRPQAPIPRTTPSRPPAPPAPASAPTRAPRTMSPRAATSPPTTSAATCESALWCAPLVADGPSPVYEYPLNGQWIMMDIDDGYILWTGIWKGASPFVCPAWRRAVLTAVAALGNSKGVSQVVLALGAGCSRCPSGHRENDRFAARPRATYSARARRLP